MPHFSNNVQSLKSAFFLIPDLQHDVKIERCCFSKEPLEINDVDRVNVGALDRIPLLAAVIKHHAAISLRPRRDGRLHGIF